MGHKHIEFLERALVEQKLDPLTRGQLAFGVLRFDPAGTTALTSRFAPRFQFLQDVFHRIDCPRLPLPQFREVERRAKGQTSKFANKMQYSSS